MGLTCESPLFVSWTHPITGKCIHDSSSFPSRKGCEQKASFNESLTPVVYACTLSLLNVRLSSSLVFRACEMADVLRLRNDFGLEMRSHT